MPKHCPICNRSSSDAHFYGEFCEFCTIERLGTRLPSELKIVVCKRCARIKVDGVFIEKSDEALGTLLSKGFKEFDTKLISSIEGAAIVELDRPEDNIMGIRREVELRYSKAMCPKCNRKSAGYYEAVVQLRGSFERTNKMAHKIEKYINDCDEFISKIETVTNGYDLYLSSKKAMSAFVSERGLKPVMSYELYGTKNGKRLYRNTYALHLD
ncbi:MAG: hypothetical protein KGH61_03650 [Candidatus Micrarchaeota archaeon]|nr:hypothetical protein [Candidatus Micrarchaeota archaeon]MDE1848017.1 hypothetical protein [Candidatus Micrarchaeota archaeon]MDE1864606.1 hypothetical protein [Candidatus Micrarchaeota archaeon]